MPIFGSGGPLGDQPVHERHPASTAHACLWMTRRGARRSQRVSRTSFNGSCWCARRSASDGCRCPKTPGRSPGPSGRRTAAIWWSLPNGWDSQLGGHWPGGVGLSRGQWQKLALDRGLMRERPALLVFDEPSSGLDPACGHALFERFGNASAYGRTTGRRDDHSAGVPPVLDGAHGRSRRGGIRPRR